MPTYICFMGSEGGESGGRLVLKVQHDHEEVADLLSNATKLVRFDDVRNRPVHVNPAAVAYVRAAAG